MKYFILRNQTVEHLFNNLNAKYSNYDDISFIDKSADIIIWFYQLDPAKNINDLNRELRGYVDKINYLFNKKSYNHNTILILPDIRAIQSFVYSKSIFNEYSNFIKHVFKICDNKINLKYLFLSDFTTKFELNKLIDWKYYYISGMIINPKISKSFQSWFKQKSDTLNFIRKKCLVLDCDNTLWGGVVGEDGVDGIQLGDNYPGKAFSDFQKVILELNEIGVILALCSKNNEQDVLEVFSKNTNMILKAENISSLRINWNNKADNILEISKELNIGLNSIVFLDDNPSEREIVKQLLPEVTVPNFPDKEYDLLNFIKELSIEVFSVFKLTNEDKNKSKQYLQNIRRKESINQFSDLKNYIKSLNINIDLQYLDEFNIERIAQMTQKTNQFNLTTNRYLISDLNEMIINKSIIICASIKDKFGDSGITGLLIFKYLNSNELEIDNFLLSCRILGKEIESTFLNFSLNLLRGKGFKNIYAKFIPTKKNQQVENFYEKNNFEHLKTLDDGSKLYSKLLKNNFEINNLHKIKLI